MATSLKQYLKVAGPGLLFASTCIGTSHLVLSTRAGAHYGMIYFGIIFLTLVLKYPFYEFGPRYTNATGISILQGYREEGKWAVYLFMVVIFVSMFAVVGAVAAVSAGLLTTLLGTSDLISVPLLAGLIISLTIVALLWGGYKGLDHLVKIISLVLLLTVCTAFIAVLIKGPIEKVEGFQEPALFDAAGLAVLVGLIGWMPAGMEVSVFNSLWSVEKAKATAYHPSLKESLTDFNAGYLFSLILALMFLTIGAFTVFGSGELLTGNATQFTNKLLTIFTTNLGKWSYYVVAIAAFGTIYGTLLAVQDAFPRCFVGGLRVLRFDKVEETEEQQSFLTRAYRIVVIVVGVGAFCLFYFSAASMIKILEVATIVSFLVAPVIAWLNLRAIQSSRIPESHRPSKNMILLAYIGLFFLVGFALFYLYTLI